MDTTITAISKFAPEDISMDFERLRTEGITHLEDLATYIWTDFNAHDPGITILEILCYAITDLGYRTNLPIEDLLSSSGGSLEASFFPSTTVLPVCPITQNDYRKLLIDFPGVRNAWVERVYPQYKEFDLWLQKIEVNNPSQAFWERLIGFVDGDFVRQIDQGDDIILDKVENKRVVYEGIFTVIKTEGLSQTTAEQLLKIEQFESTALVEGEKQVETIRKGRYNSLFQKLEDFADKMKKNAGVLHRLFPYFERTIKLTQGQLGRLLEKHNLSNENISLTQLSNIEEIINYILNFDNDAKLPQLGQLLDEVFCEHSCFEVSMTQETDYKKICLNGLYRICIDTHQDIEPGSKAARKLIKKIQKGYTDSTTKKHYKGLCEYRNLGEDVHDIQIVSNQKINLCLDISVEGEAEEEEVMAEVLFRLQEFLTPSVKFYNLQQLLEKGRSCDDIFNGPLLCNGFIDDEELEKAVLPRNIRLSDLYKIILDTPKVLTVNSLKTRLFEEGSNEPVFSEEWCMAVDASTEGANCPIKPIIELRKSSLCVRRNGISTEIGETAITDRISLLRLTSRNLTGNTSNQLEFPTGTFRPDLADYLSVQYEFPHNYTIGENGVSEQASPLRKAQAKQLQAYLLFFDRLLGDYLKQLSQVRDLLSVDQDAESATYFYQSLYHVPGIRDLINDPALDQIQTEEAWRSYQIGEDEMENENHYISKLQQIVETPDTRFNRKHRVLNHLLARFGEQFTAYAVHIFKTRQHHLEAKADFLKALPELGPARAKAYNYKAQRESGEPDVWAESRNVAGLKERIYKLLGWGDATTESVFNNPAYRIVEEEDRSGNFPRYFLSLYKLNEESRPEERLLRSTKSYTRRKINTFKPDLNVFINNVTVEEGEESYYDIAEEDGRHKVQFSAPSLGDLVLQSTPKSEDEATLLLMRIKDLVNVELKNNFHLLEHILLRPNDPADALLQMSYTCDLQFCPVDPYSFWISIIVPAWIGPFQEEEYRNYFMQLVRRETPAHLAICFRWVEEEDMMENLEHALEQWREALAACSVDECDVTETAKNLVGILNDLPCDCYCFSSEITSPKC